MIFAWKRFRKIDGVNVKKGSIAAGADTGEAHQIVEKGHQGADGGGDVCSECGIEDFSGALHFGRSEKAASDEAFFCSCGCVPFDGKRNEGEQDDSGKQDDTNPDQIHRVEEGAQQDDIDRKLAAERNDGNENRAKAEPAIAFRMRH